MNQYTLLLFLFLTAGFSLQICTVGDRKTVNQWTYLYSVRWSDGTRIPICNATSQLTYKCVKKLTRTEETESPRILRALKPVQNELLPFETIDTIEPDTPLQPSTPSSVIYWSFLSVKVTNGTCDPFYVAGDSNSPNATLGVTRSTFTYNGNTISCSTGNDISQSSLDSNSNTELINNSEFSIADTSPPLTLSLSDEEIYGSAGNAVNFIYFAPSCGLVSNGCIGNCTTPEAQEKATISLSVPYGSGAKYGFEFPIIHACTWDMIKTNYFKNASVKRGTTFTFPAINTSKKTCSKVTSQIQIYNDTHQYKAENPSTSALSIGEYNWDLFYSITQNGVVRTEKAPETYKLCVVDAPQSYVPSFTSQPKYNIDNQYYFTSSTTITLIPPKNPCPSFDYTTSITLQCGDKMSTSSRYTIPFPSELAPISCTARQTINADTAYTTPTSFFIHFIKFAVKNIEKENGKFKVTVTTWTGTYTAGNELYNINDQGDYTAIDYVNGVRYIYVDPQTTSPAKLFLWIVSANENTVISLNLPTVDLIPATLKSINYNISPKSESLTVSWDSEGGYDFGNHCYFKVTTASSSHTATEKVSSSVSSVTFYGITESSKVTVISACEGASSTENKLEVTTCFPKKPTIKLTCNNCISSDDSKILISPFIDLTCSIVDKGTFCNDDSNYLTFVYDTLTQVYSQMESSYSIKGKISSVESYQYNDQPLSVYHRLTVGGFDFTDELDDIVKCIVLPAQVSNFDVLPETTQYFRKGEIQQVTITFNGMEYLDPGCIPTKQAYYKMIIYKNTKEGDIVFKTYTDLHFTSGKNDWSCEDFTETGIYTIHPVAVAVDDTEYHYKNVTVQICDTDDDVKPVITQPVNGADKTTVVYLQFSWNQLDTKLRNLKCKATDTLRFLLEIREVKENGKSNFVTAGTLNMLSTRFIFKRVFKLNTKYEWRVNVELETEKTQTREQSIANHYSDTYSFTTMPSHCVYTPCKEGVCDYTTGKCECYSGYRGTLCDKSGLSSAALGGIIAGVVVILAITLVVIFIFLKRRYFSGLRIPDLSQFKFAMPKAVNEDGDKAKPIDFVAGVLETDPANNFVQALWLLERTPVTELDSVCRSLTYFFEQKGAGLAFIIRLIHYEVERSETTETLFRNNSYASKSFKTYARMIGLPYLFRTIFPLINKLYKEDSKGEITVKGSTGNMDTFETTSNRTSTMNTTSYEINIEQNENDGEYEDAIAENALLIQIACETFLKSLKGSNSYVPEEFKCICREIKNSVMQRYPGYSVDVCIASFIFLRFFVAGITVPESFGIIDVRPTPALRRRLILISKVLSNMSTNVKFGDKEDYMIVMNDYLESKQPQLKAYFAMLVSGEGQLPKSQQVPEKYFNASLSVLSYAVEKAENGEWEEEYC